MRRTGHVCAFTSTLGILLIEIKIKTPGNFNETSFWEKLSEAAKFRSWGPRAGGRKGSPMCWMELSHPGRGVREERMPACAASPGRGATNAPGGSHAPPRRRAPGSLLLSPELPRDRRRTGRVPRKPECNAACPPGGAAVPGRAEGDLEPCAVGRMARWSSRLGGHPKTRCLHLRTPFRSGDLESPLCNYLLLSCCKTYPLHFSTCSSFC